MNEDAANLDSLVTGMLDPRVYPWCPERVELVDTHISWVFLAGPFVVKVKRPVVLGFLDHSTLELRRRSCAEEVRLNQRLTSEMYLCVIPITRDAMGLHVDGAGEPIEWATLMRRLPDQFMLDRLIADERVFDQEFNELARRLIAFHSTGTAQCAGTVDEVFEATSGIIKSNLRELEAFSGSDIPGSAFSLIAEAMSGFLERSSPLMRQRIVDGFVKDGHGDLRCEHICFEHGHVQVFDCVEFNPTIRCADICSDLAFLLMDLERLGRSDLSRRLVQAYREAGLNLPESLLAFYVAHRALVRAKTELLSGRNGAPVYLGRALRSVATIQPLVVVMSGLSGTGKSTIGRMLGQVLSAPVIASDVVRKELAGGKHSSPEEWEAGMYSPSWSERTYDQLVRQGSTRFASEGIVILDGAFLKNEQRALASAFATTVGATLVAVETTCSENVAIERLKRRQLDPTNVSDADLQIYLRQRREIEFRPPDEFPGAVLISIDTGEPAIHGIDAVIRLLIDNGLIRSRSL